MPTTYLSFSGFKVYDTCPKQYYYKYILKPVPLKPFNKVHTLFGDIVGKIFELFYTNRLYEKPNCLAVLFDLVRLTIDEKLLYEMKIGGVYDWNEPGLKSGSRSLTEVEHEIIEAISRGLRSLKRHNLISRDSKAEVVLDQEYRNRKIVGRADFIIRRGPEKELVIVDGKGSRYRDAFIDVRQLYWYAALYWLKHQEVPSQLGFLYWRSEPEKSMDWIQVSKEKLVDFLDMILGTFDKIETNEKTKTYTAALSSATCKLCLYRSMCTEAENFFADRDFGVIDGEVSF